VRTLNKRGRMVSTIGMKGHTYIRYVVILAVGLLLLLVVLLPEPLMQPMSTDT
jgi:hypothetical protein